MINCYLTLSLIHLLCLTMSNCDELAPSLFINHGGGPFPVLGEKYNMAVAEMLKDVPKIVDLKKLKAIIVVTAHREEEIVTISSGKTHNLLYDYNNFPPESYKFKYGAPGDPILAREIHDAFANANIPSRLDDERGWDHGVFIPMMLINPAADIPIVQVSILKNQNAERHFEIGQILYQFRKRGVAIFGSGMSYHNMKELRKDPNENLGIVNVEFDQFLNEVCTDAEKIKELMNWEAAPQAYDSHPLHEADHLMPLLVTAGAGGNTPGRNVFSGVFQLNFKLSGFIWDAE